MKVGFLQFDVGSSSEENINKIKQMLCNVKSDIIVLPELAFSGYLFDCKKDLLKVAETIPNGYICSEMMKLSKEYGCTFIFGMAEKDNNSIYNTAVVVNNGNYIGKYRKIHLSNYEKSLFCSGDTNKVFEINGFKFGVQICFDLWFSEVSREQILNGADLLCVLANFGGETTYDISRIRAIENLTPLVLSNRVGAEESKAMKADFLGKSTVVNHNGERLIEGKSNIETFGICDIGTNEKKNVICSDFIKEISFHYVK